jgi:penicillin-binding protein 2
MIDTADIIELPGLRPQARRPYRYYAIYGLWIIILGILAGRSFYLQVMHGAAFRSTAEGNRVAARLLTAPRGIIYDVHGQQLVENVASTDVVLDPAQVPRGENESVLIEQLPQLVPGVSATDVQEALQRTRESQRPVRLATALDHDTVLAIERKSGELPGVQLVSSLVRRYRDGRVTAPFLGYTGYVAADDLESRGYLASTDIIGKTGIEQAYDEPLHGKHGVSYEEINAAGATQKHIREELPLPGRDLHLSLDIELQQFITDLLTRTEDERAQKGLPAVSGAVVALDPRTGGVRALVSYPSYDANVFSQPKLGDQTAGVINDPRQLLFNRAVAGMYPPGSTIKPFIAAGALAENIISGDTTFLSTGGLQVGPWNFPDWKAGGHGVTDVKKALAESVNTFFYLITGGDADHLGLGVERTRTYLAGFGWGEATAIDVPNEAPGFLPTEAWKLKAKGEPWYIGDTYHLAIGQGDVLVTPLQIAVSTAAVANGGFVHQPSLVQATAVGEEEPEPVERSTQRVAVPAEDLAIVREGMRDVVTKGSGRSLSSLPLALAGKTGTAQVGTGDDTHAWFTSWGPYESPELVVTILLERGGAGDKDAVPLAKEIWQWWSEHRPS